MAYYPINLDLAGRKCLVVGGGVVAERKINTLLDFNADVVVVSSDLTPNLRGLASEMTIEYLPGEYDSTALEGVFLVIAATDDREVNKRVSEDSQNRGILVNVVDDPELCTFFVPATIRRGKLVVSISTSGGAPSLARRIREQLETHFGSEYGDLVDLMSEVREEVKAKYATEAERRRAFIRILDSNIPDLLEQGRLEEARGRARQCI